MAEHGISCPSCNFRYTLTKGGCMHFTCTQVTFITVMLDWFKIFHCSASLSSVSGATGRSSSGQSVVEIRAVQSSASMLTTPETVSSTSGTFTLYLPAYLPTYFPTNLRDKEPADLQKLLKKNTVEYLTAPRDGDHSNRACR